MMACFLTWKMLLTIIRRRAIKHWNFWTLVEFSKFHFCLKKKEMVLIIIIRKRSREILVTDVISSPSTLGASPHWGMDWRGLVIQRVFRSEINMLDSFVWPLYRPHEAGGAGGAVAPPIYFQYSIVPYFKCTQEYIRGTGYNSVCCKILHAIFWFHCFTILDMEI